MKKISKVLLMITVGILVLTFYSCRTVNTISKKGNSMFSEVGDYLLDNQVLLENIKVIDKNQGKFFNVELKNLMFFDLNIEAKMDFYDSDGVQIDNPWGYKPVKIENGQSVWISLAAPNKEVKNFKLSLKLAE